MRKDTLWIRLLLAVAVLWIVLTTYKIYKRMPGDPFYDMPRAKAERRAELGRGTWTFLHIVAAKYPVFPTREEQANVLKLVDLLTKLFPCEDCRGHFAKLVGELPPKVANQDEFSTWLCEAHNIVNKRLGKRAFDCKKLDKRWDCGCAR
jgi:Erv1 / Alr family